MTTENTTTTAAPAVLDPSGYQAISNTAGSLNWPEKLEGMAWSIGFRLAWLLVVTVMVPVKLFTGRSPVEATEAPLQRYPLSNATKTL